jgi:CheY-like chemotaxis protein
VLHTADLSASSSETAIAALAEVDRGDIGAVLIDLRLRSAVDLVDALRDPRRPRLPILVLGGSTDLPLIQRALQSGADDFIMRTLLKNSLATRLQVRATTRAVSSNFTPVSLSSATVIVPPQTNGYCTLCTSIADGRRCGTCGSSRPAEGWPPKEASGLPYLGAVFAGKFLLVQFIAEGSSGTVYRALDLYLKRHYAAKVIELAGVERAEREAVEREAQALVQLGNPHVAPIYELHELLGERLLVISEFVDGCTLATLVGRSGPLPVPQALDVVRQVAQGLHEAHGLGMVHRDVKPSSIMVQQLPAGGRFVRVLDFGLVRLQGMLESPDTVFGTPLYAAPEQLLVGHSVDARSDVFSLGLVLLYMLTGASPRAGSLDEIVEDRLNGVSDRLAEFEAQLPGVSKLAPLVGRMTSPKPDDRIPDMQSVILAIDRMADFRMDTGAWSVV